jgi:tetratricopeptide (TPR) repeat protein
MRPRHQSVTAVLLAAALAVPAVLVSRRLLSGMADRAYDIVHVPQASSLRVLSPALRLSVANLYWLGAVQYLGDRSNQATRFEKLYPIVDLVTDLDPRHGYAYQSAGITLSASGRLEESDAILEKGIRNAPRWSFPFYLAFNAFFYRQDYEAAARWAEIAARMPGASHRIRNLALTLKVKSGSPDDAVRFLAEMRGAVGDDETAATIEEQLKVALLQRNFAVLDEAVARFRGLHGRLPLPLDEVVWSGLLPALPEDPYGGRYYLDPSDGLAHSTARDFRMSALAGGPARVPTLLEKE